MENKWEEEEERSNRGNENSENMGETVKDQRYRKRATSDQTSRVIVNANRSEISCFAVLLILFLQITFYNKNDDYIGKEARNKSAPTDNIQKITITAAESSTLNRTSLIELLLGGNCAAIKVDHKQLALFSRQETPELANGVIRGGGPAVAAG